MRKVKHLCLDCLYRWRAKYFVCLKKLVEIISSAEPMLLESLYSGESLLDDSPYRFSIALSRSLMIRGVNFAYLNWEYFNKLKIEKKCFIACPFYNRRCMQIFERNIYFSNNLNKGCLSLSPSRPPPCILPYISHILL